MKKQMIILMAALLLSSCGDDTTNEATKTSQSSGPQEICNQFCMESNFESGVYDEDGPANGCTCEGNGISYTGTIWVPEDAVLPAPGKGFIYDADALNLCYELQGSTDVAEEDVSVFSIDLLRNSVGCFP